MQKLKLNSYYVSTQGRDSNPGTLSRPWKTIQKAANAAKAGDTVNIRGGVYNERPILKSSGNANNYLTFTNYSGEVVTIDGKGIDWGYNWDCLFDLNQKSYIKLIGLRVINSKWFGIGCTPDSNGCQHITVQNCSTFNTKGSGIIFFHGADITIDGNSVEQACTGTASTQECISLCDIATFVIKNNHVFNCTNSIEGTGGEGIDAKEGCSNGKIFNNIVNDVIKVGIFVDAYSKHEYNIEVYGNKIYNSTKGIAVATEQSGLLENVRVYNNLIYNCVNWGLVIGGWSTGYTHAMKDISFIYNTVYNTGDGGIYLNNGEAQNVVVVNNIFATDSAYAGSTPIYVNGGNLSKTTLDHNLLNRVVKGQPTGTNYIIGDPRFVNVSLFDFHLQPNSPSIKNGVATTILTDFNGKLRNFADIGAFKY